MLPEPPLQRIQDEQGYIVIGANALMTKGSIQTTVRHGRGFRKSHCQFVVIGEATKQELVAQRAKYGTCADESADWPNYYKTVAE